MDTDTPRQFAKLAGPLRYEFTTVDMVDNPGGPIEPPIGEGWGFVTAMVVQGVTPRLVVLWRNC